MLKFCYITDLIRIMMKEAENLIKGSVNEDDFFIVHDDLVLMTSKETIKWMMSKFFCITDLIRFMMKESEKLTKWSVHEEDFFIVHDALVLMTSKETIKWMKK